MAWPVSWKAVILFSFSEMTWLFFSLPMPTLIKAAWISDWRIKGRLFLAARMAASLSRFSRSAPVKPAVVLAVSARSTSSPRGLFLAWTFKISSLPLTSGRPTEIFLSKRPGLKMAGSRISARLVAAMTIMPSLTPKPSISTSSWLRVCSLSSWEPPRPVPLRLATASISSIKTMQGASFLASSNISLTREAPTPTNISTKSEPEMLKKGTPASPATALASSVLPVPGTPSRSTPLGILAPTPVYLPGSFRKSMISSRSSFSSCRPATSFKVTEEPPASLARLLPKFIILLLAPPPPCCCMIIQKKKMHTPVIRRVGRMDVRKEESAGTSRTRGSRPASRTASSTWLMSVA